MALNMHDGMTINELRKAIPVYGPEITMVVQSEPGCGKSSLLKMIAEDNGDAWRKPADVCAEDKYDYVYVDCPLRDVMDMGAYIPDRELKELVYYVSSLINIKSGKPKIVMLDEFMKAPKMMQVLFTRLMLERVWGDVPLPEGSIVFATSNNQSDGVGDFMLEHAGNRVMLVPMKKPNALVWNVWASENGISRILRAWVAIESRALASYLDGGQEDNPYIFKPGKGLLSFVSPRSLAKSDVVVRNRDRMGGKITMAALAGTLGQSAAGAIEAFMGVEKELIPTKDVIADPENIPVPELPAALFMMMFNAVDDLEVQDDLTAFMKFMKRVKSSEAKAVFFTMLMGCKRTVKLARGNEEVRNWAAKNLDLL